MCCPRCFRTMHIPGEVFVASTGSATSDRTCTPCPPQTYQPESATLVQQCIKHTNCTAEDKSTAVAGNTRSDAVCLTCPSGSYFDRSTATTTCVPWTECDLARFNTYLVQRGTPTSDRVCAEASLCLSEGVYLDTPATPTSQVVYIYCVFRCPGTSCCRLMLVICSVYILLCY